MQKGGNVFLINALILNSYSETVHVHNVLNIKGHLIMENRVERINVLIEKYSLMMEFVCYVLNFKQMIKLKKNVYKYHVAR